jgi:hypothetical protein
LREILFTGKAFLVGVVILAGIHITPSRISLSGFFL